MTVPRRQRSAALAVAGMLCGVLAQDGFELALQHRDAALELWAFTGVLVDLPRPEQLLADGQPAWPRTWSLLRPSARNSKSRWRCDQQICRRRMLMWL